MIPKANRQLLDELIIADEIPTREIAKLVGCTPADVSYVRSRLKVQTKFGRDFRQTNRKYDHDKIIEMVQKGYYNSHIAETIGCHPNLIHQLKKKYKLDTSCMRPGRRSIHKTAIDKDKIKSMLMERIPVQKIADELNCSVGSVYNVKRTM